MRTFGVELKQRHDLSKPGIHFAKNGSIVINKALADLMGLEAGQKVAFGEDEGDWFVYKDEKNGFKVRQASKGDPKRGLMFGCANFVKLFRKENYKYQSGFPYEGSVKCKVVQSDKKAQDGKTDLFVILVNSFKVSE